MPIRPLPPVPAPAVPQRRLCMEVGPRLVPDRHTLVAVTSRSFTVLHAGKRERHDNAHWHAWLQGLYALGPVHINGHPMLPPGQAPLVAGVGIGMSRKNEELEMATDWTPEQRRERVLRATNDVLTQYRIVPEDGPEQLLTFGLHGGSEVWRVEVDPSGATPPTCTCPDFKYRFHPRVACKHVFAILLSHPNLRFLALDCFL